MTERAREALERGENIGALILADQALEGLLRDTCVRQGCNDETSATDSRGRNKFFPQWTFADYVNYLEDIGFLTPQEKVDFFKFHNWRNLAHHHNLEPSKKAVERIITAIQRFTNRLTLPEHLTFLDINELEQQGRDIEALQLYHAFYNRALTRRNDAAARMCLERMVNLALQHREAEIRRKVLVLLRSVQDPSFVPALTQIARNDPKVDVRVYAVRAIASKAGDEVVLTLISALDYELELNYAVRQRAAIELRKLDISRKDVISALIITSLFDPEQGGAEEGLHGTVSGGPR